jgi:Phage integrase family
VGQFRDIPLPLYVAEGIDKHIASHGTTSDGYLFQGRRHKHVTRRTYQEDFARAAEKAGLPPEFIPHSLRHCYASAALARGIPITEVSRWLGHRSIEVTHQIYGTSSPPPGTRPEPSSRTPAGPAGASHRRKTRAESVLTPGRPAGHLPAVTTPRSTMMQIFEGLTRIAA